MADVGKNFETLPIDQLICAPLLAVAQGQAELCRVYLDNLFSLAFKKNSIGKENAEVNSVKFKLNRMVLGENGETAVQQLDVEAPLLALVPVPALTMDEATVRFTMEVKEVQTNTTQSSSEVATEAGFSKWGFHADFKGKVTSSSQNTRTSDHSAKYDIFARAVQQPPAEGMAKLTSIFASVIEPVQA